MPSLKEYKAKLDSLKNTRKMTRTMKMVAASKLYKAMDAQRKATFFIDRLMRTLGRLSASVDHACHPFFQHRKQVRNVLLVLFTSDKGLCGGFNNNLIRHTARWIRDQHLLDRRVGISFCGRRGHLFFRQRAETDTHYEGITHTPSFASAKRIGSDVCRKFLDGAYDEVYIGCNHFLNPLSQKPRIERLLPASSGDIEVARQEDVHPYLFEPNPSELLGELLPRIIDFELYYALLENAAGENGARMTAMDSATANANKMIRQYTLLRNRARQAGITKELIEIVSGAEALKG